LILPVLLLITAVNLNHARGPFWLAGNLDPEYVYLLNASNMAHFKEVGHIDHPGTTVQLLGAITLRAVHFFQFSRETDLQTDVLLRPEYYLNWINAVLVGLNVLIFFIIGLVAYRLSRNVWIGLWLQLAPFFSITLLKSGLTRVSPEPLLFFASLVLVLLLVKYLYTGSLSNRDIIFFSLVMGFGIATKVTFLPLIMVPVIIFPGIKKKLLVIFGSIFSFIIFTLPIIRMYDEFFGWIFKLLSHKKGYGTGERGLISLGVYLKNIKKLLITNPFFFYILLASIILAVVVFIIPKLRAAKNNKKIKLMVSLIFAQVLGILMVGKHLSSHYLVPVLSLSGITLILIIDILKDILHKPVDQAHVGPLDLYKNFFFYTSFILLVLSFLFFNPLREVQEVVRQKKSIKANCLALQKKMETQYKDWGKIFYYASSAKAFALKFGNDLSRNFHARKLHALYNKTFFYDFLRKDFYSFDYAQKLPFAVIRERLGDRIAFQGSRSVKIPGLKLKRVAKGGRNEIISILDPEGEVEIKSVINWIKTNIHKGSNLVLPKEFGVGLARLQTDYHVVPGDYRHSHPKHFYWLADFLQSPFYCVPSPQYYGKGAISKGIARRLMKVGKRIDIQIVLPDEQNPLFLIGPLSSARSVNNTDPLIYKEVQVWYPYKKLARNISPALHLLGRRGDFNFYYSGKPGDKVLTVINVEADKQGKRFSRFGFRNEKKGFSPELSGKRFIHFLVKVCIPSESWHLINKNNFLFIQVSNGKWERDKVYFSGTGWFTYLMTKEIYPGVKDLQIGIQFVPDSPQDKIMIKDIKLFLSE